MAIYIIYIYHEDEPTTRIPLTPPPLSLSLSLSFSLAIYLYHLSFPASPLDYI